MRNVNICMQYKYIVFILYNNSKKNHDLSIDYIICNIIEVILHNM